MSITAEGETDSADLDLDARTGLTLKRIGVWTEESKLRMRMMSAVVESCEGVFHSPRNWLASLTGIVPDSKGGALVSLIHGYTDNGDPFVRRFTEQILEEVRLLPSESSTHS